MVQPGQSFLFGKINVQNLGRSDDGKQRKKKGLTLYVNNASVCM